MVFPGVEVGIQLRFINKMEERSPSCVVSLDMDLLMGPFVVCAVHASEQGDASRHPAPARLQPSEEPKGARCKEQGARSKDLSKMCGAETDGATDGGQQGPPNDTHPIDIVIAHCQPPFYTVPWTHPWSAVSSLRYAIAISISRAWSNRQNHLVFDPPFYD